MSAQDLADRCEEIGHPIPRNVIANMESGRRTNLPLVEVMVLAEALRTTPICLIIPVGRVDEFQAAPPAHPVDDLGRAELVHRRRRRPRHRRSLRLFRMHHAALSAARTRDGRGATTATTPAPPPTPERAQTPCAPPTTLEQLSTADHDTLRRVRAQMRSEGLHLPASRPTSPTSSTAPGTDAQRP